MVCILLLVLLVNVTGSSEVKLSVVEPLLIALYFNVRPAKHKTSPLQEQYLISVVDALNIQKYISTYLYFKRTICKGIFEISRNYLLDM